MPDRTWPNRRPAEHDSTYTGCMQRKALSVVGLALLMTVTPLDNVAVAADGLELSFNDGRVTVVATDVPVTEILAEWARVGNTEFVDADSLSGPLLSLQLIDVLEGEALRVLLRSATGYVAAPRLAGDPRVSSFDRVLIMRAPRRPPAARTTYAPALTPSPVGQAAPGQLTPGRPGPGGDTGFVAQPDDLQTAETQEELELIEQLRGQYQEPSAPVVGFGRPSFMPPSQTTPQADPSTQTAPRPGMIIDPSQTQQRLGRPIPVQPQAADPSR